MKPPPYIPTCNPKMFPNCDHTPRKVTGQRTTVQSEMNRSTPGLDCRPPSRWTDKAANLSKCSVSLSLVWKHFPFRNWNRRKAIWGAFPHWVLFSKDGRDRQRRRMKCAVHLDRWLARSALLFGSQANAFGRHSISKSKIMFHEDHSREKARLLISTLYNYFDSIR